MLDLDSARRLLDDLDGPACVIVKHNNPCGAAEGESAQDAYEKALACDPLSAFGGVIAINRPVDRALAELLHANFVEVLIAPGYDDDAMEMLRQKEAIRILEDTEQRYARRGPRRQARPRRRPRSRRPTGDATSAPRRRSRRRPSRPRSSGRT